MVWSLNLDGLVSFKHTDFGFTRCQLKDSSGLLWFLSAVWTLILTAPIHCRGSIAEQVMKQTRILDSLRVRTFLANFHLWLNLFFNEVKVDFFFQRFLIFNTVYCRCPNTLGSISKLNLLQVPYNYHTFCYCGHFQISHHSNDRETSQTNKHTHTKSIWNKY